MIQQIRKPNGLDQRQVQRLKGHVHDGSTQNIASSPAANPAAAASALGWLVAAGADTLVTDAPRNWLAAPEARPIFLAPAAAVRAAAGPQAARPLPVARVDAADLATLDAALLALASPRDRANAPQLLTGNIASRIIILGDQPEATGSAGERLATRMLAAIGLSPEACARAHLLPWPTPGARPPKDEEIAMFAPFRARAFELAAPRLILAFGDRAMALSGQTRGIAASRGKWLEIAGVPMLATFHPRILLTQPELKRLAWADLQAFASRLETA